MFRSSSTCEAVPCRALRLARRGVSCVFVAPIHDDHARLYNAASGTELTLACARPWEAASGTHCGQDRENRLRSGGVGRSTTDADLRDDDAGDPRRYRDERRRANLPDPARLSPRRTRNSPWSCRPLLDRAPWRSGDHQPAPAPCRPRPGTRAFLALNKNDCVAHERGTVRWLDVGIGPDVTFHLRVPPGYAALGYCAAGDPGHHVEVSPVSRTLSQAFRNYNTS